VSLFSFLKPSDPCPDPEEPYEELLGRIDDLEKSFGAMQLEWETVTAHLDQLSAKTHRELGHITRRKREVQDIEGEAAPDEVTTRRSRFRGGRHQ